MRLPEGTALVDEEVTVAALRYIVNQQNKAGSFPIIGRFHNSYLMVRGRAWRREKSGWKERTIKERERKRGKSRGMGKCQGEKEGEWRRKKK